MTTARFRRVSPMVLAFLLAAGFALLYGLGTGTAFVIWEDAREQSNGPLYYRDRLCIRNDGTSLLMRNVNNQSRILTLDGKSHVDGAALEILPQASPLAPRRNDPTDATLADWRRRVQTLSFTENPPTYWYFVLTEYASKGRGHFVGYNALTNERVGYIGSAGFSPSPLWPSEEFRTETGAAYPWTAGLLRTSAGLYGDGSVPGRSPDLAGPGPGNPGQLHLHADGRLLRIDLYQRTITDVLGYDDVVDAVQYQTRVPLNSEQIKSGMDWWRWEILVRRPGQVVVFDPEQGTSTAFSLPGQFRNDEFELYSLADGTALIDIVRRPPNAPGSPHSLFRIDRGGSILQQQTVVLNPHVGPVEDSATTFFMVLSVIAPGPLFWSSLLLALSRFRGFGEWDYRMLELFPGTAILLFVSIAATCAAARWQRRFQLPRSYGWLAFVFLLGLPGLVGYIAHRR